MSYLRKVLIIVILLAVSIIPVKAAGTMPAEYNEAIVELRGAWVSTVVNIDIGVQTSIEQYQEQYIKILDNFEKFNMNAVFFQVRPVNDAFYKSDINPWSKYLTGIEGKDPGWDPLPWLVEETHKRGMEFHAWLNPYRASMDVFSSKNLTEVQYEQELTNALALMDSKNFAKNNRDLLIQGGKRILLNPAEEEVRQHIYDTISEIVTYDVDAIHFDDYFYTEVSLNKDKEQYLEMSNVSVYVEKEHKNWRRHQVDLLVEGIHNLLEDFNLNNNREVQFGISPAAGWAPAISSTCPASGYGIEGGMPGYPCYGYSSYHDLYADTRKWVKEEWLDYMLPQNYFELGRYHEAITDWWSEQVEGTSVKLYMGLGVYQYENIATLQADEYVNQIKYDSQYNNVKGFVIFSYKSLASPINSRMADGAKKLQTFWTRTPLLPAMVKDGIAADTVAKNLQITRKNLKAQISFETDNNAIGYALYRFGFNQTPDFDNDNISNLIKNTGNNIVINNTIDNTSQYKYYVKAILKDGTLSNQSVNASTTDSFNNTAPTITRFAIPSSDIYQVGDYLRIEAEFMDIDGDDITVLLEYDTEGNRYRYKYYPEVINNRFIYEFKMINVLTENGSFRLTLSDGSSKEVAYSKPFMVVPDGKEYLELQIYFAINRLNNSINNITGGK